MKMKWCLEIIQDFDGLYCANMTMGGFDSMGIYHKPYRVNGIAEYVSYKTLRESIRLVTGVSILKRNALFWFGNNRKRYAYIDATQYRPGKDCRVSKEDINAGWKPDFS